MTTLLLRLQGAMQSYGTQDRFSVRTTERQPTFSAIIGMIAFAKWGTDQVDIDELAELAFGVRTDVEGHLMIDFHTVQGGKDGTGGPADMVLSRRHYLTDAVFLVGLEGPDPVLAEIAQALHEPEGALFLGRRCCVPSAPVLVPSGLRPSDLTTELSTFPWLGEGYRRPSEVRLVLPATAADATSALADYPLSFS